ncbi:MAG: ABC transporter substrate-binding protein [Flavobacteriaceae bacterium]|jgi:ABC-type transport system substrate-binding protein
MILCFSCTNRAEEDRSHSVFRYNEYGNITSLDPAFSRSLPNIWATTQLFNGLIQLDDSLRVTPDIAESWSVSKDGLTYEFKLREDVYFHQHPAFGERKTRKVNASDFVYSLSRLSDPELASPGGWVMQNVKKIEVKSDHQLTITLKKPFPAFLGLLSMRYCSVIPKEVVKELGENFRSKPVGTGPFAFKNWEEDVKLVFRKNPFYFEKDTAGNPLPYLEAVAISFVPDKQSEFMLFLQGKLDLLNSLDNSYKDELLTREGKLPAKYSNKINLQKGAYLNTEYFGFYLDSPSPVIQSPLIREAINLGFDRKKMMIYLRNNIGFKGDKGFIPKGLGGHSKNRWSRFQPQKAATLVETFKRQTGLEPKISLATDPNYIDLCEYIQRELQKIGIMIKVEVMPPAILKQARSSGKLEMFRSNWIADYPDAENYLSLFYSKNFSPSGPNYTHHQNSGFDQLYEKSFTINDPNERSAIYQIMDSLAMTKHPMIPLFYDQVVRFSQKNIIGLTINPVNDLKLKKVRKQKNRQ